MPAETSDQPEPTTTASAASPSPAPETPAPEGIAAAPVGDAPTAEPVIAAPAAVDLPPERVGRGLIFSLIAVPLGVIVFVLIYSLGFIASIVAFAVAFAALWLYRFGSGGRVGVVGAVVVSVVTLGTLALAFLGAQVFGAATAFSEILGIGWFEVLLLPEFPAAFTAAITDPEISGGLVGDALFTALFGVLGCGALLFNAFRAARATPA
jgi:hypothetical protein